MNTSCAGANAKYIFLYIIIYQNEPVIKSFLYRNGLFEREIWRRGGELPIKKADELFIPYDVPGLRVEGDAQLVLCNPEGATYDLSTR